jgi:hypothetical protein
MPRILLVGRVLVAQDLPVALDEDAHLTFPKYHRK